MNKVGKIIISAGVNITPWEMHSAIAKNWGSS